MLKPSDFNNAVPQFSNGNYASNPINPQYVEEPSSTDYNRGTEPLQTLPAQWWNWFINKFTSRFNKVNIYVKNLFNELAQLLSLVNVTPDGTESSVTDGQLKNAFKELYPDYINTKLALESTYVKKTQKVNNHALSGDITVTKSDVGLGNVPNVSTNDQTPTYTEASALTALSSGEKLSIAFGKLAKAVSSLISHINNTNNPHSVTKAQVQLSNVVNTGDSATPVENGTTKFTTGGAYNLKTELEDKIGDVVDVVGSLPTDAILHYSFDDVPDLPDGTVDVRLDGNTYSLEYGVYAFNNNTNATFSNDNGILVCNINNGSIYLGGNYRDKLFKCVIEVTSLRGTLSIHNGYQNIVQRITNTGIHEIALLNTNSQTYQNIYLYCEGTNYSCSFRVLKVYCGNGSYNTPIIDNSGNEINSSSNNGIALKGLSGKGYYFPSGLQTATIPTDKLTAPTSNDNLTISFWLNIASDYDTSTSETTPIISVGAFEGLFGFVKQGAYIVFVCRDDNGARSVTVNMDKGKWHHYLVVYNGTTHQATVFVDSVAVGTTASNTAGYQFGSSSTFWRIWSNNVVQGSGTPITNRPSTFDDVLIFNRALSANEINALYLNKANTPKYYGEVPVTRKVNGYALDKDITLAKSDVGLGSVVNTGDSATPVSGGTTKFTTGGAYNLLTSLAPIFSTSISYAVGDMVTYSGKLYTCTIAHSAGAWNASHFTVADLNNFYNFTNEEHNPKIWTSRLLRDSLCKNWVKASGVPSSSRSGDTIKCIHYANNIWVALGNTGSVTQTCIPLWSTDGITWNQGTGLTHFINNDLYFANNIWVAVGNDGMAWSTDGKTWTEVLKTNVNIYNVLFANGIWVAVQHSGSPWWSTDGKNWTQSSSTISSIANNKGRSLWNRMGIWVIFAEDIYTSSDGKTWTQRTTDNVYIFGCFGNGEWLAINGSKIYKSTDGTTWNSITNSSSIAGHITFGDGLYVCGKVINSSTRSFVYSQDGIHWSDIVGATDLNHIDAEKTLYHNGLWVSVNSLGYVAISYDGVTWIKTYPQSVRSLVTAFSDYYSVYAHDGKWVIGGSLLSMYCSSLDNAHL